MRFEKRDIFQDEHEYRFVFDAIELKRMLIDGVLTPSVSKFTDLYFSPSQNW